MVTTASAISSYSFQSRLSPAFLLAVAKEAWLTARQFFAASRNLSETASAQRDRRAAFSDIIQNHDNLISRLCFSYSHTKEEFEDLRQDAYINIWQGLTSYRGEANIKTWVYRVTLNTCVTTLRKKKNSASTIELNEVIETPAEDTELLAKIAALHEAISTLPALDRAIVLMWLDEMSYDEIAEVMGMGRNTVATRLHRAKNRLKTNM